MKDESRQPDSLDRAIDAVKNDTPSDDAVAGASERVRAAIAAARRPHGVAKDAADTPSTGPAAQASTGDRWDCIEDYIAAIPAYLAGKLSPARTTLFEEEARQSVPLRRALNEARGNPRMLPAANEVDGSGSFPVRWLAAAATVAAMAIALFLALPELPSFNQSELAQVSEVDGRLYQIVDGRLESLTPGTWVDGGQRIRSAGDTRAVITLDDGSQVEIDERSELSMTRRGAGNRIDVSRGRILVVASPQGSGTLDVYTDEFEVSVTGTIFEVAHGAKGSRVAVIEGSVDVALQGNTTSLEPGEVMESRDGDYNALSLLDDLAWSKDADRYIAMLQEVAALSEDLQAVLQIEPRYSTRLLDLVPENTTVYVAVPNAAERVADVYEVIQAGMRDSNYMNEYWAEFEASAESHHINLSMAFLREIGFSLGDETVFAVTAAARTSDGADGVEAIPVILSEVDAAAFTESFDFYVEQLREALLADGFAGELDELEIALITHPSEAVEEQLSILLYEDILVVTIDPATLAQMYENLQNGSSGFTQTELHSILQDSYAQGTELLGAVDLAALLSEIDDLEGELGEDGGRALAATGLANAGYLIAQYQQRNDSAAVITADLFFDGQREGIMSWLATPGSMGSLEFFSTDTTMVAALLMQEPAAMLDQFEQIALPEEIELQAELNLFYSTIGILGGEVAIGLDGPTLPTPAWKVVIEAYDATTMQENIEWSVARFNELAAREGLDSTASLAVANAGSYSGYRVDLTVPAEAAGELGIDSVSFNYAYVDGYMVAGPNRALVERAIDYYESGSGLQTSSEYRELMLRDGYLDFSAVYFSRLGQLVNDVMQNLPASLSAEQREAIDALDVEVGPSMTSILALPDRMHLAHSGSTQLPAQILSRLALLQPAMEEMAQEIEGQGDAN